MIEELIKIDNEINDLKETIRAKRCNAAAFITENRKELKNELPKRGRYYKLLKVKEENNIRTYNCDLFELQEKFTDLYVKVIDDKLYCSDRWGDGVIPEFKVILLDKNLDCILSHSGRDGLEIKIPINFIGELAHRAVANHSALSKEILYVINIESTDLHKIGVTNNMKSRLSQIATSSPFELSIVKEYKTPIASILEKELHEEFSGVRAQREWFKLSAGQLKYIDQYVERRSNYG